MITILGADWCPACTRAKRDAEEAGLDHRFIQIPDGKQGWDLVEALSGKRSIPQVFYHFGGSGDFKESLDSLDISTSTRDNLPHQSTREKPNHVK